MKWNKDITGFGWLIVGAICVLSGIQHMIRQEIYGKVRVAGSAPLMEGWPVFTTGLTELLIGLFLIYLTIKRFRN